MEDWFGTSGRIFTHYEADFGLVETGLRPMVHTLRITSGQWRTGLGPMVGVVPTMTLTSGRLRTSLGPVVQTLRLTLSQWRMILVGDQW